MLRVLASDPGLQSYAFDCYGFPTSLIRLPGASRRAGIRELANGLSTHLKTYHRDKKEIVIVGHSLGGVIARFHILECIKASSLGTIRGAMLYAVPNTGAGLASISTFLSIRHGHAAQLCKGSDFLDALNNDWARQRVEDKLNVVYVIGGSDDIVAKESSGGFIGISKSETLIDHGHKSIVKAAGIDDIRYKVLKDFILDTMPNNKSPEIFVQNTRASRHADPLFDVYSESCEPYYSARDFDDDIEKASTGSHIWVSGPSGVGKTAALKRLILRSGWHYHHVMLASFRGLGALALLREVCNYLYERAGKGEIIVEPDSSLSQLLKHFRAVLGMLPGEETLAIFVEEIPLGSEEEYADFLNAIYHVAIEPEFTVLRNRVIWIFSSINPIKKFVKINRAKFFERMQFVGAEIWNDEEIFELIKTLKKTIPIELTDGDSNDLVKMAKGSPRFVKLVLRHRRNKTIDHETFGELLSIVAEETKNAG